jgi:anti-anti-sigma factor
MLGQTPRSHAEHGSSQSRHDETFWKPWLHEQVIGCRACAEVTIYLNGELDIATAPMVEATMSQLDLPDYDTLIIDLADVSFMDSRGIQMLMKARALAADAECSTLVRSPQPIVAKALHITGVDQILSIGGSPLAPPSLN